MSTNFFGLKRSSSAGALNAMVDDGFEFSLGPPESGFSLFLAERTKKVHFIRHAEVSAFTLVFYALAVLFGEFITLTSDLSS